VALLKILIKEHWKITPEFIAAEKGFEQNIKGTIAGLVIGDRAFKQIPLSKYRYDLGLAWKEMTGLPFVFAAWVSNKKMTAEFINSFNAATSLGLQNIDAIVASINYKEADLNGYYKNKISFLLDDKKKAALKLFLSKLN
jgi:chorismate dehydratase